MPKTKQETDISRDVAMELLNERCGQRVREGYDTSHDDAHDQGELAEAAAAYAIASTEQEGADEIVADLWPLEWDSMKAPKDRRRALVISGALIMAEIERIDRAATAK